MVRPGSRLHTRCWWITYSAHNYPRSPFAMNRRIIEARKHSVNDMLLVFLLRSYRYNNIPEGEPQKHSTLHRRSTSHNQQRLPARLFQQEMESPGNRFLRHPHPNPLRTYAVFFCHTNCIERDTRQSHKTGRHFELHTEIVALIQY